MEFWESKGHVVIPSSSIVPENDPTTLFTGSGMQPMVPYLLGAPHPLGVRIADIQKCFRGQDIEEVGDNRHDSFFEMMGNWSLGDYFKKDQLTWYFEFLIKVLGFDKNKLYVTCFEGSPEAPKDLESYEIWKSLGVTENHIKFYGVEKNWWSRSGVPSKMPVGEIGGPDSEVFYDFGIPVHEGCHPNCDCGRFLEIGNSVFIQYQKQQDGTFVELKQKNVDFGGGLERTLAALNNNPDIFKTDIYSPIINNLEKISGNNYGDVARNFRVIADHIKAAVFLISAGVVPSNKDRGYILRRLIRRSVRFGNLIGIIGIKNNFLADVAKTVIDIYGEVYDELNNFDFIVLTNEETKFRKTLEAGLKELNKLGKNITGKEAFYLYETFGFPRELIEEEIGVDLKTEFEDENKRHQELSRTASAGTFKGGLADHSEIVTKYHTATHLLQAALRKVLGESVRQEGSNLTAERLRFDFSWGEKLTEDEVNKIQKIVNSQIGKNLKRNIETMSYDEAIKSGAMAFFNERYPEKVTVYSFEDFSREICGGPHVENTGVLGKFEIYKEEAVSAGVRRIYGRLV